MNGLISLKMGVKFVTSLNVGEEPEEIYMKTYMKVMAGHSPYEVQ